MSEDNSVLSRQKDFVKDFVSKFRVGPLNYRYQFALVTYSYKPTIHFYLDTYENDVDLQNAIDAVEHQTRGPTLTGEALRVVRENILIASRNSGETI